MEGIESLHFSQQIPETLNNSRLADSNIDQITLHCRRDHLSPTVHQGKASSVYNFSYSPIKTSSNYNQTEVERGLSRFRKFENSTSMLPTIPKISQHSNYQKNYKGHSQDKPPRSKQKESFFLKSNWALDPTSNYKKDFLNKDSLDINKHNGQRFDHNQIKIFKLNEEGRRDSNYKTQFKAYAIKKEAEMSLKGKDHFKTNSKENLPELKISQYQRRYDSVMQLAKPKDSLLSIYRKDVIARRK